MDSQSDKFACRICGLYQDEEPWGEDGKTPSFNICDCCGSEFGYEDCTFHSVENARTQWKLKGYPWYNTKYAPIDWSLAVQLTQIPSEYQSKSDSLDD